MEHGSAGVTQLARSAATGHQIGFPPATGATGSMNMHPRSPWPGLPAWEPGFHGEAEWLQENCSACVRRRGCGWS